MGAGAQDQAARDPFQAQRAGAGNRALAQHGHPFAALGQQGCNGDQADRGAVGLAGQVAVRGELHRSRTVAPERDRVGGFPFILAHEQLVGLGRLAPVDRGAAVLGAVVAVLPEGLANAGAAAAVHALGDGRGNAVRLGQQGRQARSRVLAFMAKGDDARLGMAIHALGHGIRRPGPRAT